MSKRKKGIKPKIIRPEPDETTFLGFHIPGINKKDLARRLVILAAIAITVKVCMFFLSQQIAFVDYYDISYYEKFAISMFDGKIPYVNFNLDYPQGILFTIFVPYAIVFLTGATTNPLPVYAVAHQVMMVIFDVGTVISVYLIGLKLYDRRRAFVAALLYATAVSASYFVITKYDAFPTFLLTLSIALYIYGRETKGYLAAVLAFIAKWFPAVAFPYFIITDIKKGVERKTLLRNIGYSVALVLAILVPFLLMSPDGFIYTYTINAKVPTLSHGFLYLMDYVTGTSIFGNASLYLLVLSELALLGLYYRQSKTDNQTLINYIMFAVLAFIIFNRASSPQHLQWIAPFLALALSKGYDAIIFYVLEVALYIEFPLAYGRFYDNASGYGAGIGEFAVFTSLLVFLFKYILLFVATYSVIDNERSSEGLLEANPTGGDLEKPVV